MDLFSDLPLDLQIKIVDFAPNASLWLTSKSASAILTTVKDLRPARFLAQRMFESFPTDEIMPKLQSLDPGFMCRVAEELTRLVLANDHFSPSLHILWGDLPFQLAITFGRLATRLCLDRPPGFSRPCARLQACCTRLTRVPMPTSYLYDKSYRGGPPVSVHR